MRITYATVVGVLLDIAGIWVLFQYSATANECQYNPGLPQCTTTGEALVAVAPWAMGLGTLLLIGSAVARALRKQKNGSGKGWRRP